jgi:hypothetical protein
MRTLLFSLGIAPPLLGAALATGVTLASPASAVIERRLVTLATIS